MDQPEECRAVVIENGKLAEIIVEHSSQELVKGNIYQGVISRVVHVDQMLWTQILQ